MHSFGVRPPPSDAFIGPHNPIVRDGLLYYAYYDGGVRVFDLLDPTRPIEIGYYSYPGFAWSPQIELSLYNLRGQRIATLATGARSAGLYSFAWTVVMTVDTHSRPVFTYTACAPANAPIRVNSRSCAKGSPCP